MDQIESNTHSFIVKIWLEEVDEKSDRAAWRGHITHVPSGERRHFENLAAMNNFIRLYLREMGVKAGFWQRARCWFKQLSQSEKYG